MAEVHSREVFALKFAEDRDLYAIEIFQLDNAWVYLTEKGTPVAGGGIKFISPGVASTSFIATDEMNKRIWVSITRHMRTLYKALAEDKKFKRLECLSADFNTNGHYWFENHLGMKKESEKVKKGKNGESYFLFTRMFV